MLDREIVAEPLSNDLLAVSRTTILPKYRGENYGNRVMRKIIETVGYHCGAVVMRRENETGGDVGLVAEKEPSYNTLMEIQPTKDPSILLVAPY